VGFSGRARRKEYWLWELFTLIVISILATIQQVFVAMESVEGLYLLTALIWIFSIVVFLPSLAVTIRRLHDLDKSGGYIFIGLIPIVGGIWLFVQMCRKGTVGDNRFGADPKAVETSSQVYKEDNNTSNF
jgi:hypothetical protein